MNKVFLLTGSIFLSTIANSQTKLAIDSSVLLDNGKLVSNYTFRRLVQKDFSKITTGDNGFSKAGRYATLDLNKDESKFYFSPFVFISKQDPLEGSFRSIHSIDITGSINSSNIFDFKKKNTITLAYSFTKVFDNYKFYQESGDSYKKLKKKLDSAAIKTAHDQDHPNDLLNMPGYSDTFTVREYRKKLLETIADNEEKWAADKWTRKRISWVKFNFNIISFDNFYIIDTSNKTADASPIPKSLFTPSLNISFNSFNSFEKGMDQLYYSVWTKLGIKHTLSEFAETSEWVKYQKLSNLSYITTDKNDVYTVTENDLESKLKPDFGAQLTYLFNATSTIKTGIDLSATYKSIVSSVSNSNAVKLSLGIIFPFTDKNGEASINIEPFYAYTRFSNFNMGSKNFWGIRFGLPFTMP